MIKEQDRIIKQRSWKDFNKLELLQKITKLAVELKDQINWDKRENEMRNLIESNIGNNDTVVVVTGVGHIPYFQSVFRYGIFQLS